jgi:predicted NUDIX family NTP pyrophosphohydrolase
MFFAKLSSLMMMMMVFSNEEAQTKTEAASSEEGPQGARKEMSNTTCYIITGGTMGIKVLKQSSGKKDERYYFSNELDLEKWIASTLLFK